MDSPQWAGVHCGGVGGIEYQTIVLENSIKSKLNFLGKLGCTLHIVGKCSMSRIYGGDFLIFRWMVKEIEMNFEYSLLLEFKFD
jgi:hypothetical protein